MFKRYNIRRSKILLMCCVVLIWGTIIILESYRIGQFPWYSIGVTVIILLLLYLARRRTILKIIGEYPHPTRGKHVISITWLLVGFLLLPFTLFLLEGLAKTELDIKGFAIFVIVPVLFGYAIGISRIPNITQKIQTGTICVIKKLATSTVLFIIFLPLLNLVNKLVIDIFSVPDFHLTSIARGFYVWLMIFCFYIGLILFIISIADFVVVIKDLSIKKREALDKLDINFTYLWIALCGCSPSLFGIAPVLITKAVV